MSSIFQKTKINDLQERVIYVKTIYWNLGSYDCTLIRKKLTQFVWHIYVNNKKKNNKKPVARNATSALVNKGFKRLVP